MSETRSTSVSIDVFSMRYENCNTIYPHMLVRPLGRYKVDTKKNFGEVLNDLKDNKYRISQLVADNPVRSDLKECKCHSAWYACEYCFAKGVKLEIVANSKAMMKLNEQKKLVLEKLDQCQKEPSTSDNESRVENLVSLNEQIQKNINALKKKTNILWPFSTMNAPNRSRSSILKIVAEIENKGKLSHDEAKDIVGRSHLLGLEYFNFVYDSPAEYMHSGCLGVVKRLVALTFNLGGKKGGNNKTASPDAFNKLMMSTKVTKECSRRARKLDFAVFKAQEFRNIGIFFFIHVIDCIEIGSNEINLWLHLAYMLRSAVIPSQEFANTSIDAINESCAKFYELFEKTFGPENCPYYLHVFCCHLMEIRTHGPLTETSAFKFESFYGEIRRSFVPGTVSPLKQILKNILLKRSLRHHSCSNKIFISNYETPLESNRLIYTYVKKKYEIFQITDIDNNTVTCNRVGKYPAVFQQTPSINWSTVGVFKKGGICSETTKLCTSEVCGKVLIVGKYLVTCPINVLNEK